MAQGVREAPREGRAWGFQLLTVNTRGYGQTSQHRRTPDALNKCSVLSAQNEVHPASRPDALEHQGHPQLSPGPDPTFLPSSRVMTYREHTAWVVKAYLQKHPEGHIMSVR